MDITAEHIEHWREHGWVVVPEFLGPDHVAAAVEEIEDMLTGREMTGEDHGGADSFRFPFSGRALNAVAAEPRILAFLEQAIGTRDIALIESIVWPKRATMTDYQQPLHVDYATLGLTYPRVDGDYREVAIGVYYTDVTEDTGPTYLVSTQHSKDRPLRPVSVTREEAPELYAHEQPAVGPAGSIVIWGQRIWHRGSDFRDKSALRYAHFLNYASARHRWLQLALDDSCVPQGGVEGMRRFLIDATPRGRELVGFPGIDDPYWNEETIAGVGARYPGMDMTPYWEAAGLADRPDRRVA